LERFLNVKLWLYGLASTVISGAAGAIAVVVVDPKDFNLDEGFGRLLTVAAVMGIIALFNYLQRHPVPEWRPGDPEPRGPDRGPEARGKLPE
jgi:hypothetical protein